MKRINSLNDLWGEELSDLLNAENQLIEALPKMAEASQSLTLKMVFEAHLEVTKVHVARLQNIFSHIGQNPQRLGCKAMKRLIEDSTEVINATEKGPGRDAAIISVAQRMEHYEIERYKTAHEHAADLGHTKMVELLDQTLNEERAMNLHLSELAQGMINIQAINPRGFYVSQEKFDRAGIKKKPKNMEVSRFISEGDPNVQDENDDA